MNHYGPREVDGVWRYTVSTRTATIVRVGYCASCPGHSTPEAACQHFTDWLLDVRLTLDAGSTTAPCQVCHADAHAFALVDRRWAFDLCPTHMTKAAVADLFGTVGVIISSL